MMNLHSIAVPLSAPRAIILGLSLRIYVGRRCNDAAAAAGHWDGSTSSAFVAVVTTRAGGRPAPFRRSGFGTRIPATAPEPGPAAASAANSRFPRFTQQLGAQSDGSLDNNLGDGGEDEEDELDIGQQGTTTTGPPVYDRRALAREVFANPYFYDGDADLADVCKSRREKAFHEGTTVEQVFLRYMTPPGNVSQLVTAIKATDLLLEAYFAPVAASIEDMLAQREIVALSSGSEIAKLNRRYVRGLPTADRVRRSLSYPDDSRNRRLCYIFGPSGSGKSFFAMKEMRGFGNEAGELPEVTLYLTPEAVAQNLAGSGGENVADDETVPVDFRREDAPDRLVERVISLLDTVIVGWRRSWGRRKLKMHVSLVFDEAGAPGLNGLFDKRVQVDRVVELAEEKIAESVMVVVAGTGLAEFAYDSRREVYVFRMESWSNDDMERILEERKGFKNKLRPGESVRTVVNAAFFQPALAALATNARSAGFLANSIERTARLARYSWVDHLSMIAPEVISRVVSQYEDENVISTLCASQRRRVAAWVFAVLATLKKGSTLLPDFGGLDRRERAAAASLLQYNVEANGDKFTLIGNITFSACVTPAIAIILYSMCGIPANVLIGWRSMEETASLFATRRLILEQGKEQISSIRILQECHVANRSLMSLREFDSELDKLGEAAVDAYESQRHQSECAFSNALERICLIRLAARLQRPTKRTSLVSIPMVTNTTVLLNAQTSSFADVIAPYTLIQTKPTLQNKIYVNIEMELEKCCLLKGCPDLRVLRGLIMVWDGSFSNPGLGDYGTDELDSTRASEALLQESVAYPENLIEVRPPVDPLPGYATIDSESNIMVAGEQSQLHLPSLPPRRSIEFILFTNAESIQLRFPNEAQKECTVTVDRAVLGSDLQLSPEKIGETNSWYEFLDGRVMEGVRIRFVLTNPRNDCARDGSEKSEQ